jgi:hypothetical protein
MAEASVQGRIYSVFWKDLSDYFLAHSLYNLSRQALPHALPP